MFGTSLVVSLIFTKSLALAAPPAKLAIAYNADGKSTSTSNPLEDHIRKGAKLALKSSAVWVNHGESVPQTLEAINEVNRLRPLVLVGLGNSFQALLAAERLSAQTVLITPVATADAILAKKANIILLSNLNSTQAWILAREVQSLHRVGQRALIVELSGCPYCVDMSQSVLAELRARKIDTVVARAHATQLVSTPPEFRQLKNFSHIVLPVFEAEAARLISLLQPQNQSAIFWGADGWGSLARYVRELPDAKSLKARWLAHYHPSINTPENRSFVERFRNAYGSDPVDTSAFFFEATQIAEQLVKNQTARGVMSAFSGLGRYKGLTGAVKVQGDHVERAMPLMQLERGEVQLQKMVSKEESK